MFVDAILLTEFHRGILRVRNTIIENIKSDFGKKSILILFIKAKIKKSSAHKRKSSLGANDGFALMLFYHG
jgi:hypothetical protein